jgi:hypothetical protein
MESPRLIAKIPAPSRTSGVMASHEMQQLWFATQRREWASLAVLALEPNTHALAIAKALVEIGTLHRGLNVKLIDATGASMTASARLTVELSTHVSGGGLAIALLDSVLENQAGIPVALAADAVLLTVDLGVASQASLRRTLELIPPERVLGTVAVWPAAR